MQRRNVKLFRFFRDLITDHTFVVSDQAELLAGDLLHRLRGTLEIGDLGVQARRLLPAVIEPGVEVVELGLLLPVISCSRVEATTEIRCWS